MPSLIDKLNKEMTAAGIKPRTGDFVPNAIKENIKRDLKKYAVAGIVPEILDLKYLYVEVNSKVYYNTNLAPSSEYVSSIVQANAKKSGIIAATI